MAQAQQQTRTRDPVGETFGIGDPGLDMGNVPIPQGAGGLPSILPGRQGDTSLNIVGSIVTAQRVAVKRDVGKIRLELAALAAMAGKDWVYGWEVKDRKNNRKVWIEGPTIKLANDLARTWGNCRVDVIVEDQGTHWMFYGRFTDYETGYQLVRGFQQRVGQNTGMEDNARARDMIFQLGQSKAIRNVVVNALQTLATFCVEEAKGSMLGTIEKKPDQARAWILKHLDELGIDVKRVEKVYGRKAENWTAPNMAKIITEVHSIEDAMALAEDVWPLAEDEQAADTTLPAGKETASPQTPDPAKPETETSNQPEASAGAAASEKLKEGERNVVLLGGARVGTHVGEVKEGETIKVAGIDVIVDEVRADHIVVTRAQPAQEAKVAEPAKPAAKKPAAGKRAPLFGGEE